MSTTFDDGLAARIAALAPEPMRDDWLDVHRRAHALRKRRLAAYALAAAFAVVLVGCTAVFGPRIVSFADSDPSPPHVVDWLSVVEVSSSYSDPAFPGFDARETRRIVDRAFAGGSIEIDLTPLTGGGYCVTYRRTSETTDGDTTDCITPQRRGAEPLVVMEPDGRAGTGGGRLGKREGGAVSLLGWVHEADAERLVLRYGDGDTSGIALTRVTEPIDASFFLFDVPNAHEQYPRRAVELIAIGADGAVVARMPIVYDDPDEWTFPRYGREGKEHHGFPPAADESRERKLVFPGTRARIWVAPAKGGVTCFIFHDREFDGSGTDHCLRDDESRRRYALDEDSFWPGPGAGPAHAVLLWGIVEPDVRRIELRFQDRTSDATVPQAGFVLYAIPERHHPPGTRLVAATLLDANGRILRRITFDPAMRDLYPCTDPVDPGLGPPVCP